MSMFCIVFNLCDIWTVEKPWGDPVAWLGYKPSINIFKKKIKSGIETADRNGQWYQHLLTLFAFVSNTEVTSFRIMFMYICLTFVKYVCFVFSTSVRFDLVKSPDVTLCPDMTLVSAIIHLYSIFKYSFVLSCISFLNLVLKRQTETANGTSIS